MASCISDEMAEKLALGHFAESRMAEGQRRP